MPQTGLIGGPEMALAGTAPETAPAKAPLMNGRAANDGLDAGPVGPENSCGFPEVVVMQSMDCRELDDLAQFG